MRRFIAGLKIVVATSSLLLAQSSTGNALRPDPAAHSTYKSHVSTVPPDFIGHWEGQLTYCGVEQVMSIDISLKSRTYSATADIPDIGIFSQPLKGLKVDDRTIQFDIPAGRGSFEGTLQDGAIVGNTGNRWDDEFVVTAVFKRVQKPPLPYMQREVTFRNGQVVLAGTLFLPLSSGSHPAVVAVHGATERTRDNPDYRLLAELLPRRGIAILLYDGRGAGQSTGNFATASFSDLAEDAIAGVGELMRHTEIDPRRIGLWGISQGGWVLPQAAVLSKDIAFLIVVSGMADTAAHQMDYLTTVSLKRYGFSPQTVKRMLEVRNTVNEYYRGRISIEEAQKVVQSSSGEAWFPLAFIPRQLPRNVREGKWFYQMDFDPEPLWEKVKLPVLAIFGEVDDQVPSAEEAARLRAELEKAGNQGLVIKMLPHANHELLVVPDKEGQWHWRYIHPEYEQTLVSWILQERAQ